MSIDKVFKKFTTDKGEEHAYWRAYDPLLTPLQLDQGKLLEIGVHHGNSIQAFAEYLPRFKIVGMDINAAGYGYPPHERIEIIQGDAKNAQDLFRVSAAGPYNVIIDDASHGAIDIEITCMYLFRHALKPGGAYVIEDLHLQYSENSNRGAMNFLYELVDKQNWYGQSKSGDPDKIAGHQLDWWDTALGEIRFYKGIAVVFKR